MFKKTIFMLLFTAGVVNANPLTDYVCDNYKKEVNDLKREISVLKEKHQGDILTLLKGRKDIIISVKHYTWDSDYILCVDVNKNTSTDMSCDFEIDSSDNKDFMQFKADNLKKQLQGKWSRQTKNV